jgi:predicted nucleotidyltransferase
MEKELIADNVYIQQLKEHVLTFLGKENVKIVFFGSRIRGDNIASSDIDIGIIPKGKFNRGGLTLLREYIDDSNIPYNVDIVDFSTTSEQFKKEALKDAEIWKD